MLSYYHDNLEGEEDRESYQAVPLLRGSFDQDRSRGICPPILRNVHSMSLASDANSKNLVVLPSSHALKIIGRVLAIESGGCA